jgi:hypothetical protein
VTRGNKQSEQPTAVTGLCRRNWKFLRARERQLYWLTVWNSMCDRFWTVRFFWIRYFSFEFYILWRIPWPTNWSLILKICKSDIQLPYYITNYNVKLPLLTDMNYDYMFRLKLAIIKSNPDISLVSGTFIITQLKYRFFFLTSLWINVSCWHPRPNSVFIHRVVITQMW